ncbi:MAG TPA: hypothetical protein VF762_00185 [Blastocatellia bacterium]|jgi:hypothetical protein
MSLSNQHIEQEAHKSYSKNTYSAVLNPEFRKVCDKFVSDLIADSYARNEQVKGAMETSTFSRDFFIRSTIETVLRIELMRKINPLVCVRVAEADPILCKQWGLYAADEGLHGRLFAKDLHVLGVTDEEIYTTKRLFATELLAGYLYQTLAEEGPLGVLASAYYVETVSGSTQPAWLDGMEQFVGHDATRGARAHLALDDREGHVDLAWNMCMRVVKTPADEERFKQHIVRLHSLFVAYVLEVSRLVALKNQPSAEMDVAPAAIESSTAAAALEPRG